MPSDMIHPFPVRRKERYVTMHGPVRIFSLQEDIPAFHRVFLQKKPNIYAEKSEKFAGIAPDSLFFRGFNQFFTKIGMGDIDKRFRDFPCRFILEGCDAVLCDHILRFKARAADDTARRHVRKNQRLSRSVRFFLRGSGTKEALSALRKKGSLYEIQLTAGAADMLKSDGFRIDLTV